MKDSVREKICKEIRVAKDLGLLDRSAELSDYLEERAARGHSPKVILAAHSYAYEGEVLNKLAELYKDKYGFSFFSLATGDFMGLNFQITPNVDVLFQGWVVAEDEKIIYQSAVGCYGDTIDLDVVEDLVESLKELRVIEKEERGMNTLFNQGS